MTQRNFMRSLYRAHRGDRDAVVAAYAEAEEQGRVRRRSNSHAWNSFAYAKALFNDGIRKGWLS
jgi:hypothetical protein